MTDACLTQGAACYAKVDGKDVSRLIQTSGSWDRALEPPSREFCDPARWKVSARTKWKREGRIDALEGEGLLLGLRHAVRDPGRRGRRMLSYLDNQALLGSARKGRSSATRLLGVCRRVAALTLFAELRLHYRYVPSKLNVADAPSRGRPAAGCEAWGSMTAAELQASNDECAAALQQKQRRKADEAEQKYQQELAEIDERFETHDTMKRAYARSGLHECSTPRCHSLCSLDDERCGVCGIRGPQWLDDPPPASREPPAALSTKPASSIVGKGVVLRRPLAGAPDPLARDRPATRRMLDPRRHVPSDGSAVRVGSGVRVAIRG